MLDDPLTSLSPSEKKTLLKRGPVAAPEALVRRTTRAYLEELITINGMPFDDWLLKMTPEDVEKLQRTPTKKRKLSLDSWKQTTEGWAVFKCEGQKGFEAWATQQTKKLKAFKGLTMKKLSNVVDQRIGLYPTRSIIRLNARKGDFFRHIQKAKDEFLMAWSFTWKEIPPALRHPRQPGFRGDLATFYQQQHDYINNRGTDISFEALHASTSITEKD